MRHRDATVLFRYAAAPVPPGERLRGESLEVREDGALWRLARERYAICWEDSPGHWEYRTRCRADEEATAIIRMGYRGKD